jgi:hypothetical protein
MENIYNLYIDESCHLQRDRQPIMLLGALWCLNSEVKRISSEIRQIKEEYQSRGEIKWVKVSNSRSIYFKKLIDYFFNESNLNFRCLIVNEKSKLDHDLYNRGSHDSFYYKMQFYLIRNIMTPENSYNIYVDMKDTKSQQSINTLKEILCNNFYDFEELLINRIQHIRSSESEFIQLADLLIGAIGYKCRGLTTNKTKIEIVELISKKSGLDLVHSTPPWEDKFNLFFFEPR